MITLLMLMLLLAGNGVLFKKYYRTRQELEAVKAQHEDLKIEDDEDVISYLEAAASCTPFGKRVLAAAREMKSLPPHLETPVAKPKYMHNVHESVPCEVHWELFVTDMNREDYDDDKLNVLRHWVLEKNNGFTMMEYGMILDMFEDSDSRACVRDIFAQQKKKEDRKKAPAPKKRAAG